MRYSQAFTSDGYLVTRDEEHTIGRPEVSDVAEGQTVSLPWALACMVVSLAVAIGCDMTVAEGHGKAIFLGLFVTAYVAKIFQESLRRSSTMVFLAGVAAFHFLLIFILPDDSRYPGGLLLPIGVADLAACYYVFGLVSKRR